MPFLFLQDTADLKIDLIEYLAATTDDEWYNLPDVLMPRDAETILGYEHESVRQWISCA